MKKNFTLLLLLVSFFKMSAQCPDIKNLKFISNSIESWVSYVEYGKYIPNPTILIKTIGWEYKSQYNFLVGLYEKGKLKKVFPIIVPTSDLKNIRGQVINDEEITQYMRNHFYVNILDCK